MSDAQLNTGQKALQINLDAKKYGTFAEIGAGQEVARWFFHVGGAAGTVAKTISAYDMAVSDAIYGPCDRYVSRSRLKAMLDYEFDLLLQRLDPARGEKTTFFAFANTVATHSFSRQEEGHGWMGIRFQTAPRTPPSEIFIHVRLLDNENVREQEALGVVGVNLVYGAIYFHREPERLIRSLLDNLTWERVEVDLIRLAGPAFAGVDNRLMALQLVQHGLTEAAMFTAEGEAVQWSELLYKKPALVQRGSFRPVTNATLDVLERARDQFGREPDLNGESPVELMEMTLRHLTTDDAIDHRDFLQRADLLRALGRTVLISNFRRFHRLAAYLARYTTRPLGLALGASKLAEIFDETFYNDHEGGLLGGLGQLFKNHTRLYVYPSLDFKTGQVVTVENYPIAPRLKHLYTHLTENHAIEGIQQFNRDFLSIRSRDVLDRIKSGDAGWERLVPPPIVNVIKAKRLFGWGS
ncbi:MAG: TonB-dependent receptor [Limisphaerales bacterium]